MPKTLGHSKGQTPKTLDLTFPTVKLNGVFYWTPPAS